MIVSLGRKLQHLDDWLVNVNVFVFADDNSFYVLAWHNDVDSAAKLDEPQSLALLHRLVLFDK